MDPHCLRHSAIPPFRREEALLWAIQTLFTASSHWVHILNEPGYFLELFVW